MPRLSLVIGLIAALVTPAAAQAQDSCKLGSVPVYGDMKLAVSKAAWNLGSMPDYSDASTAELAQRVARLEANAARLAPYADSYVQLMDRVAGANLTRWVQLVNQVAGNESRWLNSGQLMLGGMVGDWYRNIPLEQRELLDAALEELVQQMRQDIRAGRTSAMFDPMDIAHETTPEGVRAVLRLNQILQQGELNQDFGDHSPIDAADVRALQKLDDGQFPDITKNLAATQAVFYANRDNPSDDLAEVPRGTEGLPDALPNGERIADILDKLAREQQAINAALAERGREPANTPVFDAVLGQVTQLDTNIGKYGKGLDDQLAGNYKLQHYTIMEIDGEHEIVPIDEEPYRPSVVAGPGSRGYESYNNDGQILIYPSTPYAPSSGVSPETLDEAVRVKDSAGLLEGNRTELSISNIPMSPGLRAQLGLSEEYTPPPLPESFNSRLPEFFRPQQTLNDRPALIDLAALLPVEQRREYLLDLSSKTFVRSLDERSRTELTEEFDNTWLNRTVEVVDVVGWIFKGDNSDNWIGPRAERNLHRSKRMSEKVDANHDANITNAIYGRYSPVLDALRENNQINDRHERLNIKYEAQHRETEFATMMFIGTLPLSAFGLAEAGVSLARPMMTRAARTTASLVDDVARSADDLARLGDDLARGADDLARGADDLVRGADDVARLADNVTLNPAAVDEVFSSADDLLKLSDEVGGLADDVAGARHLDEAFEHWDDAGFHHRPTPLEDDFVKAHNKAFPDSELDELAIRQKYRDHHRFDESGKLIQLKGEDAFLQRQKDVQALRNTALFQDDIANRGITTQRLEWMANKQSPLSFDNPQQYQQFQDELNEVLGKMGLDDAQVSLKGTSTTFYSENPSKPLGHHFDANPLEVADVDLGLSSSKMVDAMQEASMAAHPKLPHLYKTRHTYEVFPELKAFADRWEGILGREVNFIGLTERAPVRLDPPDFLVLGINP